ncbi:C2 domain containing protein kinase C region 2 (CalB) [Entamoeba marina]
MRIEVRIIEAKDLKVIDFFSGRSDPYVKITANGQIHKTNVVSRSCNPVWNQTFTFDIIQGQQINFDVFSWDDIGIDEHLGTAQSTVSNLYPGQIDDLWLELTKKGKLHVQILSPGGLPNVLGGKSVIDGFSTLHNSSSTSNSKSFNLPTNNYGFFGYEPSYHTMK